MTILKCKTLTSTGRIAISETPLGKGGEGSVFDVQKHDLESLLPADEIVCKIYHDPSEEDRENKVWAMIESPPDSDSVAWPLGVLFNSSNEFQGYVMKKLPSTTYRSWAVLANLGSRLKTSPKFDSRYAIMASRNLAVALHSIHEAGHCVGDVNESNIMVGSDARVMIIDTDSAQIKSPDGTVYPCPVGKAEYIAAELSHGSLRDHMRTPESDVFAYSVAVFQMMTGGIHPTDGKYTGEGDPPSVTSKIRNEWFPNLFDQNMVQSLPRVSTEALPLVFKKIFMKGLLKDPGARPNLVAVGRALDGVVQNLKNCSNNKNHWFDSREQNCPWCEYALKPGAVDPWITGKTATRVPQQASLPTVDFNDHSPTPQRAPRAPAGQMPSTRTSKPQSNGSSRPGVGHVSVPTSSSVRLPTTAGAPGLPHHFPSTAHVPQPVVNASAPQTEQEPESEQNTGNIPRKIKGKSVLMRPDGSWEVRPPLSVLFRSNKRLAIECFFDEFPKRTQFWWNKNRLGINHRGLLIGLFISLAIIFSWFYYLPELSQFVSSDIHWAQLGIQFASVGAVITSTLMVAILSITGLIHRFRESRSLQEGQSLKLESVLSTAFQYVCVTFIYGVPFLILVTILMLNVAARLVLSVFVNDQRGNYSRNSKFFGN